MTSSEDAHAYHLKVRKNLCGSASSSGIGDCSMRHRRVSAAKSRTRWGFQTAPLPDCSIVGLKIGILSNYEFCSSLASGIGMKRVAGSLCSADSATWRHNLAGVAAVWGHAAWRVPLGGFCGWVTRPTGARCLRDAAAERSEECNGSRAEKHKRCRLWNG